MKCNSPLSLDEVQPMLYTSAPWAILVQERSQWQEPDSVLCFCWPGESVWQCPPKGLVVGYENGWGRRVDCASSTSYVQQCTQPSESWLEFEVCVGALFSALYFLSLCLRLYLEILGWGCLGAVLCRRSCDHCYFSWRMCWTCQGVEGGTGIQGSSCKHD